MSDNQGGAGTYKTVRASVDLLHQVVEGKDLFALPMTAGVPGPCDGKMDGTLCGEGCTCRGGQPWYNLDGITKLGFQPAAKNDE